MQAILHRFDINEETYRQRFRSVRRTGTESYAELGVRLTDLFNKWTEVAEGDAKKLAEMVIQEQLVANMPQDLQVWIRERKPSSVKEAAKWADDYIMARQSTRREKRCHNCGDVGHMYRECTRSAMKEERKRDAQEKVLGIVLIRTKWILDGVTSAMELVILLRNVQQKTRSIQDIMLGIL